MTIIILLCYSHAHIFDIFTLLWQYFRSSILHRVLHLTSSYSTSEIDVAKTFNEFKVDKWLNWLPILNFNLPSPGNLSLFSDVFFYRSCLSVSMHSIN